MDQKQWRSLQIAATILYRHFENISIEKSLSSFYDMLVKYQDGTNLKFGVIVKSSTYLRSKQFPSDVEILKIQNYELEENRLPVLLMCVNEEKETAKIGFLIGWRYGRPRIYNNIELRTFDKLNAYKVLEIIKSMDDVIRVLTNNDISVKKIISFSIQQPQGIVQHGDIIYLRKMSSNYKMKKVEVTDEKEKFNRLLKGIPQDEYPSDLLDELILQAVKRRYANAECKSSNVFLSTDIKDLQFYEGMHKTQCIVNIKPDLSTLPQQYWGVLNGVNIVTIVLELYVPGIFNVDVFDNEWFETSVNFDGWLEKYNELTSLRATLSNISDYFVNHA